MLDFVQQSLRLFDSDLNQRVSQTFVDSVLILGQMLHKDRNPGEHNGFKHIEQTSLLHIAKGLDGNLGRMAFTIGDSLELRGLDSIAPSTKVAVRSMVNSEALGANTTIICPTRKSTKIRIIRNRKEELVFSPFFSSKKRRHDSEYLLMNYLGLQLESYPEDIYGEVILMTERIPCEHCFSVIREFAKKRQQFICNVVFLYETEGRNPASLITIDLPVNVRLYKAALALKGADVTRIEKSAPRHALNSRVLEQAERMDSSAHVSSRAIAAITIDLRSHRK